MNPKSWDFTLCQALRYSIDRGKHSVSKKLEGKQISRGYRESGRCEGEKERGEENGMTGSLCLRAIGKMNAPCV